MSERMSIDHPSEPVEVQSSFGDVVTETERTSSWWRWMKERLGTVAAQGTEKKDMSVEALDYITEEVVGTNELDGGQSPKDDEHQGDDWFRFSLKVELWDRLPDSLSDLWAILPDVCPSSDEDIRDREEALK